MQKGFALPLVLAVILLVSLIGVGGYYFYQTKTPESTATIPSPSPIVGETANWKTYTNEAYKFTIKYPSSWYIYEYPIESSFMLLFDRKPIHKEDISPHPWQELEITVGNLYPSKIFTEVGTMKGDIVNGVEYGRLKVTETNFKGASGIKSYLEAPTISGFEGNPSTSIYFNYSNNGWAIRYPNTNYNGEYDPLYDQILATFKFLDDETANPDSIGANWKTYKDRRFEVKYPGKLVALSTSGSPNTVDEWNSVTFDYEGEGYSLPPYNISMLDYLQLPADVNNPGIARQTIDQIFGLKVGEELSTEATKDLGGDWDMPSKFERLPDETINGELFVVVDNPKWYGGSHRELFLKKTNVIYIVSGIYNSKEELTEFSKLYSSFKLH